MGERPKNPFTVTNYPEEKKNLRAANFDAKKRIDIVLSNREIQTEEIFQKIFNIIPFCFLKKEYYPNKADGSNEEISNIVSHSPSDIEKRKEKGKGIFYMNSCISQTLYTINELKKVFPIPAKYINLCIEFLQFVESGDASAHAFIEIRVPSLEPIIIDYARNNDVYIYRGGYKNNTNNIESLNIVSIPSDHFNENDNIVQIAEKSTDKIPHQEIGKIKKMLDARSVKLCKDNIGLSKFESWKQKQGNSPVYCLENGMDRNKKTAYLRIKLENTDPVKFFVENGKDEDGNIIWAELKVEDKDPPKIFIKNKSGYTDIKIHNKLIPYLILHYK